MENFNIADYFTKKKHNLETPKKNFGNKSAKTCGEPIRQRKKDLKMCYAPLWPTRALLLK